MSRSLIPAGVLLAACTAAGATAATINVPADQPTIQAGINAANSGDVVLVAAGIYNEAINFNGQAVHVLAEKNAQFTWIDATGLGTPVVTFENGEGADSILEGFRLTGATTGPGVLIDGSGPIIDRCYIDGNGEPANTFGGGIQVDGGTPIISNTVVTGNTGFAGSGLYSFGSGSTVDMINCTVYGNTDTNTNAPAVAFVTPTVATVRNSIIRGNSAFEITSVGAVTVEHSNVEGGYAGTGNIDVAANFVNAGGGDFTLAAGSPCIDAGSSSAAFGDLDAEGWYRGINDPDSADTGVGATPLVDIGAFEFRPPLRYVDASASGPAADGVTWATAYTDLQDALDAADSGGVSEIWVAQGTYYADRGTGDRNASFNLITNVQLLGGFAGNEVDRDAADPRNRDTVLGGAIGAPGTADNTYHVVRAIDVTGALLRGFIIRRGQADGGGDDSHGAAMLISGGAPVIEDCRFNLNAATNVSTIYSINSAGPRFVSCKFNNNSGDWGPLRFEGGSPSLYNTVVYGHTFDTGGAIYFSDCDEPIMMNCTVAGNTSTGSFNAGVFSWFSGTILRNNILWGNVSDGNPCCNPNRHFAGTSLDETYNTIGGIIADNDGNSGNDPRFVDPDGADNIPGTADDNYGLLPASPCIDSGDSSVFPPSITTDYLGAGRHVDINGVPNTGVGKIDRGVAEFYGEHCAYDCADGDGEVGIVDLLELLTQWGSVTDSPCDYYSAGGDGAISIQDLLAMLSAWGPCP